MAILTNFLLAVALSTSVYGEGRARHGLIGYGINMYDPICASACGMAIPMYLLCSDVDFSSSSGYGGMSMISYTSDADTNSNLTATETPSPECIATNTPYLQSVAWCIHMHCDASITMPKRELWWYRYVVGDSKDQPEPSMTYQESLASLTTPPNATLPADQPLVSPVLIDEETYVANVNALGNFQWIEGLHSRYTIIVVVTCFVIPLILSWLRFLPFPAHFTNSLRAWALDAPLSERRVVLPLVGKVDWATRGQVLFMAYIVSVNVILNSVGMKSVRPNAWYSTRSDEITIYIANRAGTLSFANVPLLILYAGRNNILLRLTNWSHSTFLLLHRCVSTIAVLQACLHSAIYLQVDFSNGTLSEEDTLPYWIWGIVATLAMSLLLPLSIRPLRTIAYELFLITHIVLSVFVIIGCWYHIIYRFQHQWGYENWMYVAIAVWGFERAARVVRVARNGVRKATIYQIDEDYVRMDIPNVACSGHVYVYFPQLTWNPMDFHKSWQSHPFSIASFNTLRHGPSTDSIDSDCYPDDEKSGRSVSVSDHPSGRSEHAPRAQSVTILIRIRDGATRDLANKSVSLSPLVSTGTSPTPLPSPIQLPVLIESSYGHSVHDYLPLTSIYPNILVITGGVGISGVLPFLVQAAYSPTRRGTVKLFWGSRSAALVREVEGLVRSMGPTIWDQEQPPLDSNRTGGSSWGAIDAHLAVGPGERLDLKEIVQDELEDGTPGHGKGLGGTLVIVCGPASMAQETRALVMHKAREGALVKFIEESFDW